MNIFLHRDDLRIHDNKGLKRSSEDGETLPIYIDDPRISKRTGKNKKAFREKSLEIIDKNYRERGSGLVYRKGKTGENLEELIDRHDIDKIFFNRSYTPIKRRIESEIKGLDVKSQSFKDRLLVEPQEISEEFDTFSPFYREWKNIEKDSSFGRPENLADIDEESFEVSTECSIDLPQSGEESALQRWRDFRDNRLDTYKDQRDEVKSPEAVSRLSMYYSSGILGLRKVLDDVERLIEESDGSDDIRNYAKYRNELAWREFFYQVLWHNPETVQQNYRDFENEIQWRNDPEEFEAWKKGETGVPFVDAGIRELRNTGYMHNRTRQNVASFLTKHLMIDWRKGARFFRKHLIDHDTASNIGGWQWSASTGTDSVSIRIFNPVKQGRKYDTHAEYIKRHIPELRDLDPNSIHNWVEMVHEERNEYGVDYPDPIINFNQRYHVGKKMFENALGH
ncbi:MAG: deoxyribodipyrimidine photo-lyase [Candidatus Nanohaloarchaea archaeon]